MVGFTTKEFFPAAALLAVTAFGSCALGHAQVFTVQREHLGPKEANLTTVQPTTVALDTKPLTERTKQQLIRTFQADEAFAVRPLPLGTKGIVLHANGQLTSFRKWLRRGIGEVRCFGQAR